MKSVLASFKPKYCELIASGMKTLELRKNCPKIDMPFKVYVYQTKGYWIYKILEWLGLYQGKVIGEFVCDYILSRCESSNADIAEQQGCVKREKLFEYANGKELYAWHISDLVIYDKPKELSEFFRHDNTYDNSFGGWFEDRDKRVPITRPPQSWCYVEEVS